MSTNQTDVRFPVAAGTHYPKDGGELEKLLGQSLDTSSPFLSDNYEIKAMILPGLSYKYSLKFLSEVYVKLIGKSVDELFLLSDPVLHKIDQLAFSTARYWETPLGLVEVSHRIKQIVHGDDQNKDLMKFDDRMHKGEISLEVQLPFIQKVFTDSVRIIPIMIGGVSPRISTELIEDFIDEEDLIIGVSNLSEGLPVDYAKDLDMKTSEIIENLDLGGASSGEFHVSSPTTVQLIMNLAHRKNWRVKRLHIENIEKDENRRNFTVGIGTYVFLK